MEISCSGDGPPNTTAQRSDIITSLLGGSSAHCGASAPARSRVVVRKIVLVEYDAALAGDGRGQPDGLLPPVDDVGRGAALAGPGDERGPVGPADHHQVGAGLGRRPGEARVPLAPDAPALHDTRGHPP